MGYFLCFYDSILLHFKIAQNLSLYNTSTVAITDYLNTNHRKKLIMNTKSLTLLLCSTLLIHSLSFATIRSINFSGNHITGVDYNDLNTCVAESNSGDTVYVYPGNAINGIINKKLILIGTGSFLNPGSSPKGNSNFQVNTLSSTASTIEFTQGSAGSSISGFEFMSGNGIYIGDNNITVKRNSNLIVYLNAYTGLNINNIQLLENYFIYVYGYGSNSTNLTNLNISNNFINYLNIDNTNNSGTISNNVWANNISIEYLSYGYNINLGGGTFLFQNNILAALSDGNFPPSTANNSNFIIDGGYNTVFNYNVSLSGYNGNQFSAQAGIGNLYLDVATYYNSIFQGFPTIGTRTVDDRWQLKSNSMALVANRPGSTVDAGMFGGASPYKLSTMPAIPSIYLLSSPQGNNPSGSTIQINLSTKSNN